ncbi:MAG: hypothetical protein M3457_09330 [Chloroflexota bacterium]|nr:hypothetical protein [Chloroflexota bacterium]
MCFIILEATIPPASRPSTSDVTYSDRRAAFDAQRLAVHRRWNLVANLRLLGFVALAVAAWWALTAPNPLKWMLVVILAGVTAALVVYHASLRRRRDRLAGLVLVNELAIARLNLDWEAMPKAPDANVPRSHPYAWDLDVVGEASIARRLSTPTLLNGWHSLHAWLLGPTGAATIAERQEAVRELAHDLDLRQGIEVAGRQMEGDTPDPEPFLRWSTASPWLLARPWLWILAIVSPVALVVLAILNFSGAIYGPWWLLPITVNVAIFQIYGKRISGSVAEANPLHHAIAGYAEVFKLIGESAPESIMLGRIGATLGGDENGNSGATVRMRRFARIYGFVIPRGSIIWSPMQMALLWDVHVLHALERWRASTGSQTRAWFDSAGEWEALAALSVLAHDHPDWGYPEVDAAHQELKAESLAHPLIHFGESVANDVTVGPRGTFVFVTGSNMSGKSTLLRAVGLNAVLAMAGAPVAASRLALPEVDVWTCMRVEDSVAKGVSFFMAELQRLKAVVDATGAAESRPVLYLLDEILQGTNTAERQIASRGVLAQLATYNALGGVSSHDLSLVEGSDLESLAVAVHFAETFARGPAGPEMTFDYRLRPGLATSTNALALMELLGFEVGSMKTNSASG